MGLYLCKSKVDSSTAYVAGKSDTSLFWNIDQFFDPYCVMLKEVSALAVCFKTCIRKDQLFEGESEGHTQEYHSIESESKVAIEVGDDFFGDYFDYTGWFEPEWDEYSPGKYHMKERYTNKAKVKAVLREGLKAAKD